VPHSGLIEKRREGGRHAVGAIRESPLHHRLYPSFVFVYTVLAGGSTRQSPVRVQSDSEPLSRCSAFGNRNHGSERILVWALMAWYNRQHRHKLNERDRADMR